MNSTAATFAPVVENPDALAWAFAQVCADACTLSDKGPFIDGHTPEGCFGMVVKNLGGVQLYWFRGTLGDPKAQIVGRTQYIENRAHHYVGGSLFGGTLTTLQVKEG